MDKMDKQEDYFVITLAEKQLKNDFKKLSSTGSWL
jgi:hypothetical protein